MTFTNPVYGKSFADPFVIEVEGSYYAFATNGPLGNVQTLPSLPGWSSPGRVWAPEVAVHAPDRFVMYYATSTDDVQAISVGVASDPKGPYVDKSSRPLICELSGGGSIDASPFQDSSGQRWLYWKNDGNAIGVDTWISVSRLSPDGLTLLDEPTRLIKQTLPWEGTLVEAPFVLERDNTFHLFYSANAFDTAAYAVGHASSPTPTGPFTKSGPPILTSSPDAAGPGHNMILRADNTDWFIYHAWDPAGVGQDPGRTMWLSKLTWDGEHPDVEPPLREHS